MEHRMLDNYFHRLARHSVGKQMLRLVSDLRPTLDDRYLMRKDSFVPALNAIELV